MTDVPEKTRVLLPDDEDWLSLFMGMEEPLLMQLALNARAVQEGDEEVWELPPDLDGIGAHQAWGRLFGALPEPLRHTGTNIGRYEPNRDRPAGRYTLYAPDGRWEHTPLYPADVDPHDVAAVAAVLTHFRTALDGTDHTQLGDFLQQMADDWADPGREGNDWQMVEDFTLGLSVWQLPHEPDVDVLLEAVAVASPGGETPERIVLTPTQEDAYQSFMRRVSAAVAGNSPHDITPNPASLSHEEMNDALTAGARLSDSQLKRAATHLLTSTGLSGRGDFARHVTLAWAEVPDTGRALVAEVDLTAVRDDETLYLTGSDERLLNLALSYGRGRPVHLDAYLNTFGHQTAQRVLEAHVIGMGMEGFLTVSAGGPELDKLNALHAELGIGGDDQ